MLCLQQRGSVSIRSARASAGDKLGSGSHYRKKLAVEMKTLWVNRESGVQYQPSTLSDALPGRVSAKSAHTRGRAHVWGTNFITVIASNAKCLQSRLQIFGWRTLQSLVLLHFICDSFMLTQTLCLLQSAISWPQGLSVLQASIMCL